MVERLSGDGSRNEAGGGGFEGAVNGFRTRLSGPFGCVFALLACTCLLPVVLVLAIVNFAKLRAMWRSQRAAERGDPRGVPRSGAYSSGEYADGGAGPHAQALETRAAAMLVRAMAIDESFTREEALQAGVAAGAGKSPAELLDDAIAQRWIEDAGSGRLRVSDKGRRETGC